MAALLIQQSTQIETRVDFDTHSVGASFSCKNHLAAANPGRETEFLPPDTFSCTRADGRAWNGTTNDIIAGLSDQNYRPCVFTGGISYARENTAQFCIGDL